jgi:predicted RNA binding protein YcfA (HicA-like mRNA interferase family)
MKAVSGKEMCRILEKSGWSWLRTRGSHHTYGKKRFPNITVPVHGNQSLKKGMQSGIMKTAGLTENDL